MPFLISLVDRNKATSYVHMQDAYFVDQQTIGTWAQIGYKKPASSNFNYEETAPADDAGADTWKATALFDASDCGTDKNVWSINTKKVEATIEYSASDNCPALTPNFKNIGSSGT